MSALHFGTVAMIFGSAALAQIEPVPEEQNPRLQVVDYLAGQIVGLTSAPGYQLMVELSPDETVQSIALGDSAAWQVNANKSGNRLFVKVTQPDVTTNMTVVTSVRVYNFDLFAVPEPNPEMPYIVQFRYSAPSSAGMPAQARGRTTQPRQANYRISGDRKLRPISITDDGERTYINWTKETPIPAVYSANPFGDDVLVNGMMGTNDVYVVDGTPEWLVFRIDRYATHAKRVRRSKRASREAK